MEFEDGTPFDPPINPLYEKYPICSHIGYECMYCSKCPMGDSFGYRISAEERLQLEQYEKDFKNYIKTMEKIHGPVQIRIFPPI